MEWWQIYLFTLADGFDMFFGIIGPLILTFLPIAAFAFCLNECYINIKKYLKIAFAVGLLFCLLSLLIPNTKELVAIYLIPKITKNETVSNLPAKMADLLDKKLDEWINDTMDIKKDKGNYN